MHVPLPMILDASYECIVDRFIVHNLLESAGFLSKHVVRNSFSSSWWVLAIQLKQYARQIESFPQVFDPKNEGNGKHHLMIYLID